MPVALRRADWRFLLPRPAEGRFRSLVLLGAETGLVARLRDLDLAGRIHTRVEEVAAADAVVVMASLTTPLGEIFAALRPGAMLYCEVDRRRAGRRRMTPRRMERMLSRAGLQPAGWYWAIPGFEEARRHIPLHDGAVLRWYLDTLHTAGTPLARAVELGIRSLVRVAPSEIARWVPCYSILALAPPAGDRSSALVEGETRLAMLTSAQDDGSRVVLLPFAPSGTAPARVLKVARLGTFDRHTEREQRTLSELRARVSPSLRATLPEPLGLLQWNGHKAAMESYAPGTPIGVTSGRFGARFGRAREDLRLAVSWLLEFHRQTTLRGVEWNSAVAEKVSGRLVACARLFPSGSRGPGLLALAASYTRRAVGASLPLVWLHNDLGPWNVHRSGSRITVIDWELGDGPGDRTGPAGCDLFYLVTYWTLRVRHLRDREGELRGVGELFVDPARGGRAAAAAHEEIERYAAALKLETRLLPMLLVLTWAERALERTERGRLADRAQGSGIDPYLAFLEVLAPRGESWFTRGCWP